MLRGDILREQETLRPAFARHIGQSPSPSLGGAARGEPDARRWRARRAAPRPSTPAAGDRRRHWRARRRRRFRPRGPRTTYRFESRWPRAAATERATPAARVGALRAGAAPSEARPVMRSIRASRVASARGDRRLGNAVAQHGDAVGNPQDLIDAMRDVDDAAAAPLELADDAETAARLPRWLSAAVGSSMTKRRAGADASSRKVDGDLDDHAVADREARRGWPRARRRRRRARRARRGRDR